MANYRASKRYAKAFMSYLSDIDSKEEIIKEVKNLDNILSTNVELRRFLKSPVIDNQKKIAISEEIFKPYSHEIKQLFKLVIGNNRSEILPEVVNQIIKLDRLSKGIQKAVITSAKPISHQQNQAIKEKLLSMVNAKDIEIENKVDASLLGGFKIRIEDLLYDATIKTKLDNLKKEFSVNI